MAETGFVSAIAAGTRSVLGLGWVGFGIRFGVWCGEVCILRIECWRLSEHVETHAQSLA